MEPPIRMEKTNLWFLQAWQSTPTNYRSLGHALAHAQFEKMTAKAVDHVFISLNTYVYRQRRKILIAKKQLEIAWQFLITLVFIQK